MDANEYGPIVRERNTMLAIRGGLSPWAILTGMVVALGAMLLMGAIAGAILTRNGQTASTLRFDSSMWSIIGAIGFFVAEFLAYLWAGYAAGRMARGAGAMNGLMVPLATIVLGAIVTGIVAALGAHTDLTAWRTTHLALDDSTQLRLGIGFGILTLILMFAGAMVGGMKGARWHERLEDTTVTHPRARLVA